MGAKRTMLRPRYVSTNLINLCFDKFIKQNMMPDNSTTTLAT